jgi:hypothetical protein
MISHVVIEKLCPCMIDASIEQIRSFHSREYAETLKSELTSRTGEQVEILDLYLMLGSMDDLDYLDQLEANLENLKTGLIE